MQCRHRYKLHFPLLYMMTAYALIYYYTPPARSAATFRISRAIFLVFALIYDEY